MPSLTLCLIACNEERHISDAIRSFADVANAVIVVDTGSTDDTLQVAREAGATVISIPWRDSYSEARNAGFEGVTTDWAFILDCDERLQPGSKAAVLEACEGNEAPAYWVTRLEHVPGGPTRSRYVRLARRDSGCRLTGRIHERPVKPFTSIADSDIVIDHYGYSGPPSAEKTARYERLLRLELADRPDDNYMLIDLLQLYWNGSDERWKEILPRALATLDHGAPAAPHPLAAVLLEIILRLPPDKIPKAITHAEAETLAERWFPRAIPLLALRACRRGEQRDFETSAHLAETALSLWRDQTYGMEVSFSPDRILGELHLVLGVASANLGRIERARGALQAATRYPDAAEEAARKLGMLKTPPASPFRIG